MDLTKALVQYHSNDPPVEVNQEWVVFSDKDEVLRRIRILALHPDLLDGKRAWIYQDRPAKMVKLTAGELGVCPEINLRVVFELDQTRG